MVCILGHRSVDFPSISQGITARRTGRRIATFNLSWSRALMRLVVVLHATTSETGESEAYEKQRVATGAAVRMHCFDGWGWIRRNLPYDNLRQLSWFRILLRNHRSNVFQFSVFRHLQSARFRAPCWQHSGHAHYHRGQSRVPVHRRLVRLNEFRDFVTDFRHPIH